jgi:hypothetical protein
MQRAQLPFSGCKCDGDADGEPWMEGAKCQVKSMWSRGFEKTKHKTQMMHLRGTIDPVLQHGEGDVSGKTRVAAQQ